ncbi:MAG: histidinol phosphate phosphatase [Rubrivivax sp. SCN 71-131]|jgi:D-glycero-D-manno-heptose 1,7-bisphosphate phosphatase|nr:MAG: histidinol phosphate phosphatase [Rubrivivax sp. SCN 71-131]
MRSAPAHARGAGPTHAPKLVIYGRDGVLNAYREDHVKSPQDWVPIPGALEALAQLNHAGWHAVVATNQAGIGRGLIDMATLNAVHAHMNRQVAALGGRIDAVFFCPHAPEEDCECRKPLPGMMQDIGRRWGVDLASVPMVCDTLRDLQAAQAAGCPPHLVLSGRAAGMNEAMLQHALAMVPTTTTHESLQAFAEHLLRRNHQTDSEAGALL